MSNTASLPVYGVVAVAVAFLPRSCRGPTHPLWLHLPALLPSMQHGDAFTLRLLGQRMTFVFAPATLHHYFTAPDAQLTFAPAVQQVPSTGYSLDPSNCIPCIPCMPTAACRQGQ